MTSTKRFALVQILLLVFFVLPGAAQNDGGFGTPPGKPAQDTGPAALKQMLRKLQTTARLMETTAHPDDEDGGMLTLEARGKGVSVLSLTLTRGEGGQNRTGSNLFDVLGILRTLEVMASDRYYGAEQRFSHVADFGFSKTAEETLQKWDGGEPALADIVRVIRTFRPDVIVSRFQGNANDGHGNHQACGILTREAFRAAADPNRFPEQIKEGLQPWQAKKLYVDGFRLGSDYTLALETSTFDAVLGMSYAQLATEGLQRQQSQGVGFRPPRAGPRFSYYKLVDSVLPMPAPGTREQSFFDGIDTSLPGLAKQLGDEEKKGPFLRPALVRIQQKINEAANAADSSDPSQAAVPLLQALGELQHLLYRSPGTYSRHAPETKRSNGFHFLSAAARADVLRVLSDKENQLEKAIALALGVKLRATLQTDRTPNENKPIMAMPGSAYKATFALTNDGARPIILIGLGGQDAAGDFQGGQMGKFLRERPMVLQPGESFTAEWRFTVPPNARYTRPYEHRNDPERDSIYTVEIPPSPVRRPLYNTSPFPGPSLWINTDYTLDSAACRSTRKEPQCAMTEIRVPVKVKYANSDGAAIERPVAIGPAYSLVVEPATQVIAIDGRATREVDVHVHSNLQTPADASLKLDLPTGWRAEPETLSLKFNGAADQTGKFRIFPGSLKEGAYQLKAVLDYRGQKFAEGYTVVTRSDLGEFFYYQPATQRISAVNLKVPPGLKVGYIMGAGDDIPTVLQQVGLDVHMITPEELAGGDLSRYGTIVVGIRAYDVRDDVRANNKRLLEYVSAGGTLMVQYNANTTEFNEGHYTPYPAELSHERVTVEEAPVDVLAPGDSLFHFPNEITAHDFDGWVQERGLYFMDHWHQHFEPLLACHDPGEPPLQGGLLRARYGKGTYIYTGYAFFRQLPAGIPGAVRLFVNLVSAGHEGAASR